MFPNPGKEDNGKYLLTMDDCLDLRVFSSKELSELVNMSEEDLATRNVLVHSDGKSTKNREYEVLKRGTHKECIEARAARLPKQLEEREKKKDSANTSSSLLDKEEKQKKTIERKKEAATMTDLTGSS